MNSTPRAVDLTITGRVQGVSFRARTAEKAREYAVAGWVENRDDGSVHVRAQGDPDAVESLVDWCQDGPAAAEVEDVEVRDVAPEHLTEFAIRR